jgi:hypothetical protein
MMLLPRALRIGFPEAVELPQDRFVDGVGVRDDKVLELLPVFDVGRRYGGWHSVSFRVSVVVVSCTGDSIGVVSLSWLRRNRTSETGIVDYEVSLLATKRLQAKNESQIASACPIFSTYWSLLSTLSGRPSWIFELLLQNRCIIFAQ